MAKSNPTKTKNSTMWHADATIWLNNQTPTPTYDTIITDPPYSSGGALNTQRTGPTTNSKYGSGRTEAPPIDDFVGDSRDQRSLLIWSTLWLTQCLHLTKPGGQILTATDWRQYPTFSDALQIAGWTWRGIFVWDKGAQARPTQGGFSKRTEFFLQASKGPITRNPHQPYIQGVAAIPAPRGEKKQHLTEKPVELLQHLTELCPPGGHILDPFAGSGTTGVAALQTGRQFTGIETVETFYRLACKRLNNSERGAQMDTPAEQMTLTETA